MKNYLKYSILITLILAMTITLAHAQPIVTNQTNPLESVPATMTKSGATTTGDAAMHDGAITTFGTAYVLATFTGAVATVQFSGFPTSDFAITWISIQIKYLHTGTTDDTYNWQYSIDGATWIALTAPTINKFDSNGAVQVRSFSQLARPGGGSWTWADIGALRVQYVVNKVTSWDGILKKITIYEVWASVYSSPVPPTSSPTMSLQPPSIAPMAAAYEYLWVEVYCNDVTNLAGGQYQINYDPTILIATNEYWTYYPYTDVTQPDFGADYVNLDFSIPVADPLVATGQTGNFAIARIFFLVLDDGGGVNPMPPNFSWLRLTVSFMGDNEAAKMPHHVYNGYYGTPPETSYLMGSEPIPKPGVYPYENPISTQWIEEFPTFGNRWHLASFEDQGDLGLNPSDQIDMTQTDPPIPGNPEFHVDQIWECDADPETFVFMVLTIKTIPEFPFGAGIVLIIAPAAALIYVWRTHKKVTKP